jgi:hypothetical protein
LNGVLAALVLTNLLYVAGAVVVATLVSALYVLRHRKPKSMEAAIESFSRELRALAPDGRADTGDDDPGQALDRAAIRRIEDKDAMRPGHVDAMRPGHVDAMHPGHGDAPASGGRSG